MPMPLPRPRSSIEHSADAISLINKHWKILQGSAATERILGYHPDELIGRNFLDLIHPEDREHSSGKLKQVLGNPPGPIQWDARILNKDGKFSWVDNTVSNPTLKTDVQLVVHHRNIDARKAAEEEKQRHAEELERCNERLQEFAYIAAHDLREPLRAISAYTEILVQETQMDASTRQIAKFIVDGTARMSTLIDDLLSFAAIGVREPPRSVDLLNAIEQARQNLALELRESGARITVNQLPVVRGNEIHLVRLFQNLIGNAVKYRGEASSEIHVTAERQGSDWVIRIADNGIGIAPENQARIFIPFIRLGNRDIPGTGLGLALCKNIVEGWGGEIWAESEFGAGSTFFFSIAATGDKEPRQSANPNTVMEMKWPPIVAIHPT
jgi:PAS domain S-box-containing protein